MIDLQRQTDDDTSVPKANFLPFYMFDAVRKKTVKKLCAKKYPTLINLFAWEKMFTLSKSIHILFAYTYVVPTNARM